jgi:ribosomal protein L25 (general stress protein Ctc)
MKFQAYRAYREAGNMETVKALLPFTISNSTLRRWKEQYKWDEKVETDQLVLSEKDQPDPTVNRITHELQLKGSDKDVFKQVKKIESICFAAIYGNEERLKEIALKPNDFNSAVRALKVCWDTRDKMLSRTIAPQKENSPQKISYTQMVINATKEKDDHAKEAGKSLVLGSSKDSQ